MFGVGYDGAPSLDDLLGILSQQQGQQPAGPQPNGILAQPQSNYDVVGWAPGTNPNDRPEPRTQPPSMIGATSPSSLFTNPGAPAPGASNAGPVPMPPPRPANIGEPVDLQGAQPPTPVGASAAQTLSAGPAAAGAGEKKSPGFMDIVNGAFDAIGGIYGKGGPGDRLIELGAALAHPQGWSVGLSQMGQNSQRREALQQANQLQALKLKREQAQQAGGQSLVKRASPGITDAEASAIAANPALFADAYKRTNPSESYSTETDEDGNVWQINKQNNQRSLLKSGGEDQFTQIGQDQFGKPIYGFVNKGSKTITPAAPQGVAASGQPATITDQYGNSVPVPAGQDPKIVQQEVSSATGKAIAAAPDAIAKGNQTLALIDEIKKNPALKYTVGVGGIVPGVPGTAQNDLVSRIDQLKGRSFLEAFESLKGGGQITEIEGKKATDAIARLNRTQSHAGFVQALDDLEAVIRTGIARQQARLGQQPQNGTQQQQSQDQPPVPGARKAGDGKWYVADPSRPGKYLMVTP